MEEWKQSSSGVWGLTVDGCSLSLPDSFVLDTEEEDRVVFVDEGPDFPWAYMVYKRIPARSWMEDHADTKAMRSFNVSEVAITELAPTTKSGRAVPKVRMYVLGLTPSASIMVVHVSDHYARLLAEQWSQARNAQE